MMKNECPIVRDLLPLYAEDMVGEETRAFVDEHLANCEACRAALEEIKSAPEPVPAVTAVPMRAIARKISRARVLAALCAAFIVAAVAFAVYIAAAQPHYFPYAEGIFTMVEHPDGSVTLTFGPDVTYASATHCFISDGAEGSLIVYEVQAGYTLLDRLRPGGFGESTMRLAPHEDAPMVIYYTQNNGRENVCVYGQEHINGGMQTLARLTLGYYFIIACALAAVLALCALLIRRARAVFSVICAVPVSYILAHLAVMGPRMTTYDIEREFVCILWVGGLIFCAIICALWAFHIHRRAKRLAL